MFSFHRSQTSPESSRDAIELEERKRAIAKLAGVRWSERVFASFRSFPCQARCLPFCGSMLPLDSLRPFVMLMVKVGFGVCSVVSVPFLARLVVLRLLILFEQPATAGFPGLRRSLTNACTCTRHASGAIGTPNSASRRCHPLSRRCRWSRSMCNRLSSRCDPRLV